MGRFIDLSDLTFGKLKAIARVETTHRSKQVHWLCECTCGRTHIVSGQSLRAGITTSCGCDRVFHGRTSLPPGEAAFNSLLLDYKWSAKSRNFPFTLTEAEFRVITKSSCHYCGCEPSQVKKKHKSIYIYNGIDRIDNGIGYVQGNCIPCCMIHNYMKGTLTQKEVLDAVFSIANHLK